MRKYVIALMNDEIKGVLTCVPKAVLLLLSGLYFLGLQVNRSLYRLSFFPSRSLPKPVISIGNLTVGGTGKTPLVEMLANFMSHKKKNLAILTRGYMPAGDKGESDEAAMLRVNLPEAHVCVNKNRIAAGLEICSQKNVDVLLLDDGFQYLRLKRDLNIVIIDATKPFGNGALLPRGILREPVSALKRAHMIVITKSDWGKRNLFAIHAAIKKYNSQASVFKAIHAPNGFFNLKTSHDQGLDSFNGLMMGSFCSIADPVGFRQALTQQGLLLRSSLDFSDHHVYTRRDFYKLIEFFKKQDIRTLLTTEKDAVKISQFMPELPEDMNIYVSKIKIVIEERFHAFADRINTILDS